MREQTDNTQSSFTLSELGRLQVDDARHHCSSVGRGSASKRVYACLCGHVYETTERNSLAVIAPLPSLSFQAQSLPSSKPISPGQSIRIRAPHTHLASFILLSILIYSSLLLSKSPRVCDFSVLLHEISILRP